MVTAIPAVRHQPVSTSSQPTLKEGAQGSSVRTLQTLLNQAGFNCGTVDGSFGQKTAEAVRRFQRTHQLTVDGVVGPKSWKALNEAGSASPTKPIAPQAPVDVFEPPAPVVPTGRADLQTPVMTGYARTDVQNTGRSAPVNAPLQSSTTDRSAARYAEVIDQFDVANNPRYEANSKTYCNIYVSDVMRAMNVQLPHWISAGGVPTKYRAEGAHEIGATGTADWLRQHGAEYGWKKVSMEEATAYANAGKPALLAWKNPDSSKAGHIGLVIPSTDGQTHVAQAGSENTADKVITTGSRFGSRGTVGEDVVFWVHE